jgi:hypothetical protein
MASIGNAAENMKNAGKNDFPIVLNFTYFTSEFVVAAVGRVRTHVDCGDSAAKIRRP